MKYTISILAFLVSAASVQANESLFGGATLASGEDYEEAMTRDARPTGARSGPVTLAPKSVSDVDTDGNGAVSFSELLVSDFAPTSMFRGN